MPGPRRKHPQSRKTTPRTLATSANRKPRIVTKVITNRAGDALADYRKMYDVDEAGMVDLLCNFIDHKGLGGDLRLYLK